MGLEKDGTGEGFGLREALAIYKKHGGTFHGPRIEHASCEEQAFHRFIKEVIATASAPPSPDPHGAQATEGETIIAEIERFEKVWEDAGHDCRHGYDARTKSLVMAEACRSILTAVRSSRPLAVGAQATGGEGLASVRELVRLVAAEHGGLPGDSCADDPDDECTSHSRDPITGEVTPGTITFGHIRRAVAELAGLVSPVQANGGDWQTLQALLLKFAFIPDYEPTDAELAALSPEDRGVVKGWRMRGEAMAAGAEPVAWPRPDSNSSGTICLKFLIELQSRISEHVDVEGIEAVLLEGDRYRAASPLAGSAEAGGVSDAEVEAGR